MSNGTNCKNRSKVKGHSSTKYITGWEITNDISYIDFPYKTWFDSLESLFKNIYFYCFIAFKFHAQKIKKKILT